MLYFPLLGEVYLRKFIMKIICFWSKNVQYSGLANEVLSGRGKVPVADYKVVEYVNAEDTALTSNSGPINRSCYSFCMCPGGQVQQLLLFIITE